MQGRKTRNRRSKRSEALRLLAIFAMVATLTGCGDLPEVTEVNFESLPTPKMFNWALACPAGQCKAIPQDSSRVVKVPDFSVPVTQLMGAWDKVIRRQGRVLPRGVDFSTRQKDYVQTSGIFDQPDLITVRFFADGGNRSTFAVYRRSVYGYVDFGANRRRLEAWVEAIEAELGAGAVIAPN